MQSFVSGFFHQAQGLGDFFLWTVRSYISALQPIHPCHNHSTLMLEHESSHRQQVNKLASRFRGPWAKPQVADLWLRLLNMHPIVWTEHISLKYSSAVKHVDSFQFCAIMKKAAVEFAYIFMWTLCSAGSYSKFHFLAKLKTAFQRNAPSYIPNSSVWTLQFLWSVNTWIVSGFYYSHYGLNVHPKMYRLEP